MENNQIENCRSCNSDKLQLVFSLGEQHIKDFLENVNDESPRAPLELVFCTNCKLLQLRHTFDQNMLYSRYWYRSGTSPTMVRALNDIVVCASRLVSLSPGDIVLDIGSNDGTLLRQYQTPGLVKVGFEPSNLWKDGTDTDTTIFHNYFNSSQFTKTFGKAKAKIITSIAMFYDLPNPNSFVSDVKLCLQNNGVWIIQMNYLGLMLSNLGYDNICHEHLEYYSLISLEHLLNRYGFEVFDIELNDANAGSFRLYIKNKNELTPNIEHGQERVKNIRMKELTRGFDTLHPYEKFGADISQSRDKLLSLINSLTKKKETIFVYGASTRGLVILEYLGLTRDQIPFATDKNPDKWGRIMSGTNIPIIPLEKYREMGPKYLLVLPYQYINEIAYQEKEFLQNGGKLIVPLPEPLTMGLKYVDTMREADSTLFTQGYDRF